MKKIILPVFAFVLLATSCSPDRSKLKKVFVDSCISSAQSEMAKSGMPAIEDMDALAKEYCECSGDKVLAGLTDEELKQMDKDANAIPQSRILELAQPCMDAFNQKIQAKIPQQ